jgi:hypothetical protein
MAPNLRAEWTKGLLGKLTMEQKRRDDQFAAWFKMQERQIGDWSFRIAEDLKGNVETFKKVNGNALASLGHALNARLMVVERRLQIGRKSPGDGFNTGGGQWYTRQEVDEMNEFEREDLFKRHGGMQHWWES